MTLRTLIDSGTKTATGSEQTLRDDTTGAGQIYDAYIDLGAMVSGDIVRIRLYVKLLSTGTLRLVYDETYTYADVTADGVIVYLPSITVPSEWKLTIEQTAQSGGYKAFDWAVYGG